MHGCIISTVATDALVLKHQDISTHNTDWEVVLEQAQTNILHLQQTISEIAIKFITK